MLVTSFRRELNYDELATLKHLALAGAVDGRITVTSDELAAELGVSSQTVARRLRRLGELDLVETARTNHGQRVRIEPDGVEALFSEYDAYSRIFGSVAAVVFRGTVTEGVGEGGHFMSLPGYREQFVERLGYEPFPGTLNVELADDQRNRTAALDALDGTRIDEWADDDRTYGGATCFQIRVESEGAAAEPAHLVVPDRTHHDEGILEVIAPMELRSALDVSNHGPIHLHVVR